MTSKKLIDEIVALPVEDRIAVVESILQSLNVPSADNDLVWAKTAQRRRRDLHEGRVDSVPLDAVKETVARRFSS